MYWTTHGYLQQKANGHNPFKFAHGEEVMTDDQRRDVLMTKLAAIEKRLAESPASHEARKQLGPEKQVLTEGDEMLGRR